MPRKSVVRLTDRPDMTLTQKEITSRIDQYLVILSSKTYVFEDKLLVSLTNYFFQCRCLCLPWT